MVFKISVLIKGIPIKILKQSKSKSDLSRQYKLMMMMMMMMMMIRRIVHIS
jgi:hypothetical protein